VVIVLLTRRLTAEDGSLGGYSVKNNSKIKDYSARMTRPKDVLSNLERLARNTREAVEMAELMRTKGLALHSITKMLDTDSQNERGPCDIGG